MRVLIFVSLLISFVYSAEVVAVGEKYQDSSKCQACHGHLVKDWQHSWHARSYEKNDEYFGASVEYVSKKSHKSLNAVKVECATCHNPRIAVTSTSKAYEIDAVLGLDKNSKVNKAVNDVAISEGINCVVCHNIDKIHLTQIVVLWILFLRSKFFPTQLNYHMVQKAKMGNSHILLNHVFLNN